MVMGNQDRAVLVTGATGRQGGAVARQLLEKGFAVRALTRRPSSAAAQDLARLGADIVPGDLNETRTMQQALEGAWGAFSVQSIMEGGVGREEEQGTRLAQLAKRAGVRHFVYASVAAAHKKTGIPHFESKWRIEEAVRKAGFPSYTILRPAFFMENFTSPWIWPDVEKGKLTLSLQPRTRLMMVAVEDIGRYAAMSFENPATLDRAEIELAGDEQSMPEAARTLSLALGWKVESVPMPIAEVRKMSDDMAVMFEWFDRVGFSIDIPALVSAYGIKPRTLQQWALKAPWPKMVRA